MNSRRGIITVLPEGGMCLKTQQSFRWLLQGEQVCTKWNGRAGDGRAWQAEGTRDGRHRLGGTARRLKPGAGGQNKERLRWTDQRIRALIRLGGSALISGSLTTKAQSTALCYTL